MTLGLLQSPLARRVRAWALRGALCGLAICGGTAPSVAAIDDIQPSPARRIVSLAPHLTELVYAAGAGDYLIATVAYSDFPEAATRLPQIGDASRVDLERLVSLAPDLVLGWQSGNSRQDLAHIDRLGLPLHVMEPHALDDIAAAIEEIGRLAATGEVARDSADAFRSRLGQLRKRYGGQSAVSVFYQVWDRPLMTVNGAHVINEAITLCGGINPFAGLKVLAPTVAIEAVIAADPDLLIAPDIGTGRARLLTFWGRYPGLRFVRDGHIDLVPADLISRSTPRMLDGVERICKAIAAVRAQHRAGTIPTDPR